MLQFLEYFNHKIISVKDFPLDFVKVQLTHLFFGFLHNCGKILKRKDRANILRHLESCHVVCNSSFFHVYSFIKCYRHCANGLHPIVQQ